MKKEIAFLVAITFQCYLSNSQNLIPDPGFEITEPELCYDSNNIMPLVHWHSPNEGTPHLWCIQGDCGTLFTEELENLTGMLPPAEGQCFVGMDCCYDPISINQNREYLYTQLVEPLESGEEYVIAFDLHRRTGWDLAIDSFGFYFSEGPPSSPGALVMEYEPQAETSGVVFNDSTWITIQLTYTASGGEEYMCFGNFRWPDEMIVFDTNSGMKNSNNSYYQFDNVTLEKQVGVEENPLDNQVQIWVTEASLHIENLLRGSIAYFVYDSIGRQIQYGELHFGVNEVFFHHNSSEILLVVFRYGSFSMSHKIHIE